MHVWLRVCKLMTESQVTAHFMALTSLPSPKEAAVTKSGNQMVPGSTTRPIEMCPWELWAWPWSVKDQRLLRTRQQEAGEEKRRRPETWVQIPPPIDYPVVLK